MTGQNRVARADDFTAESKRTLSARAGHVCSICHAPTSGPSFDGSKAVNGGEAAHITAAQPGGPRFDGALTSAERRSLENGIWLCALCATLIDRDPLRYTADKLISLKFDAEDRAQRLLGKPTGPIIGKLATASQPFRLGAETAVVIDDVVIAYASILDLDDPESRPTWFVNGFVVQFSLLKHPNRTSVLVEHLIVTVHETKPIPRYKPLIMAYPLEISLYYVEIAPNAGQTPRQFTPNAFYVADQSGEQTGQFPNALVLDDQQRTLLALRINARQSGLYLVSVEAQLSSLDETDLLPIMPPQWIVFETDADAELSWSRLS